MEGSPGELSGRMVRPSSWLVMITKREYPEVQALANEYWLRLPSPLAGLRCCRSISEHPDCGR